MKYFDYWDTEIRGKRDKKTYYIRHKVERRGMGLTCTIRTRRNGKGEKIAQSKGTILSDQSKMQIYQRLHKKFKFVLVELVEIPQPEKESI